MSSSSLISINDDLILEILSRLPSKSVARFRCVSKLWASMLCSLYFKELFLTRSSAKPRLLFAIVENFGKGGSKGVWRFFSLPQLLNPYSKSSSLVAAAEFHLKFPMLIYHNTNRLYFQHGYNSGLVYFYGAHYDNRCVICNPNTGGYTLLPYLKRYRKTYSFFLFDPIDKQFKVLFMAYCDLNHKILTVGTEDMKWRTIKCSLQHKIASEGICINGVLYYLGDTSSWDNDDYSIVCFDVRSEKFTFFKVERFCRLVNYKGKLAVVYFEDDVDTLSCRYRERDHVEADEINRLHVWVLEDMEKQEWLKYAYTWTDDIFFRRRQVSIAGATASGEIVFSMCEYTPKQPFYVFYFNPERETLQRVEVQGFGEDFCNVYTYVDHVEDVNVNDLELLKFVHPPLEEPKEEEEEEEEYGEYEEYEEEEGYEEEIEDNQIEKGQGEEDKDE
ncbi:F-box protein At2g23160-like [Capsella rubella]|uniref:F-box protein At2g23160-like n=1 Tax=Capsella rubella TaxID=81985 RepID=UPI000CD4E198|nr:F-box protein At2g23160-like [Capsella rubella]